MQYRCLRDIRTIYCLPDIKNCRKALSNPEPTLDTNPHEEVKINSENILEIKNLKHLLQDCALDPEEGRMRGAAHHMVRNMTAGMALITCREPLVISINNNLKKAFLGTLMVMRNLSLNFAKNVFECRIINIIYKVNEN